MQDLQSPASQQSHRLSILGSDLSKNRNRHKVCFYINQMFFTLGKHISSHLFVHSNLSDPTVPLFFELLNSVQNIYHVHKSALVVVVKYCVTLMQTQKCSSDILEIKNNYSDA